MSEVTLHKAAKTDPGITMTEAALKHVNRLIKKRGHGIGVRLSVTTTGCSGLSYVLDLIDTIPEGDLVSKITDEVLVSVDPSAFLQVKNTQLDFVREGLNEKIIYSNPNQTGACGCGESFTV